MAYTTDHLSALEVRLSHERVHLANATTDNERKLRNVWIAQVEKEIENEIAFLAARGVHVERAPESLDDISDDELLALLD